MECGWGRRIDIAGGVGDNILGSEAENLSRASGAAHKKRAYATPTPSCSHAKVMG